MPPVLPVLALAAGLALGAAVAHAADTCHCGNGRSIRTSRDCASACEGLGGPTHWNPVDRERARERARERFEEAVQDARDEEDAARAIRARGAAGTPPRRRRAVPAPPPANVTSVEPSVPVPKAPGVACLDGRVVIPAQPTREQIAFCKSR
jgi:hypothetical protein